jgi:hypothetical protein
VTRLVERVLVTGAAFLLTWLVWGWQASMVVAMP